MKCARTGTRCACATLPERKLHVHRYKRCLSAVGRHNRGLRQPADQQIATGNGYPACCRHQPPAHGLPRDDGYRQASEHILVGLSGAGTVTRRPPVSTGGGALVSEPAGGRRNPGRGPVSIPVRRRRRSRIATPGTSITTHTRHVVAGRRLVHAAGRAQQTATSPLPPGTTNDGHRSPVADRPPARRRLAGFHRRPLRAMPRTILAGGHLAHRNVHGSSARPAVVAPAY